MTKENLTRNSVLERLDQLYEFDREPVTENKFCRGLYFAGLYAGEHTAATEFVIGALFVSWGAGVSDIIVGLLLGNILAVLSWTLVCAPIAVDTRLTLYWYIHKVGGPALAFFYNICNGILYCVLAGTMITVSASAVRIPFNIPAQTLWYPTDIRFVFVVILVGALIVILAILGFKSLAKFSSICAPWMIAMFVVGAIVMVPLLGQSTGVGPVRSFSQFWEMADKGVWTGQAASSGDKIAFWHVMAFAWICNLAMHIGLSDMAAFRYARKAYYGLYTSTGMFLGHYLAWICAGILGAGAAIALKTPLGALDSGEIGYTVLGFAGAVAVVLSGWTTANPTLYKAGLAIQAVTPNWPRWKVTLVVGTITTGIACFPFVFKEMLNFIGLYGLLLLPVGAAVFTEHWIFPKIGLSRYWVSHQNRSLNWPALVTWIITIAFAMFMWQQNFLHLFFLFIPVWFLSVGLYLLLAVIAGARKPFQETAPEIPPVRDASSPMPTASENPLPLTFGTKILRKIMGSAALVSLAACIGLAFLVFFGGMESYESNMTFFKTWLMVPTALYFATATYWQVLGDKNEPKVTENH